MPSTDQRSISTTVSVPTVDTRVIVPRSCARPLTSDVAVGDAVADDGGLLDGVTVIVGVLAPPCPLPLHPATTATTATTAAAVITAATRRGRGFTRSAWPQPPRPVQ